MIKTTKKREYWRKNSLILVQDIQMNKKKLPNLTQQVQFAIK